MNMTEGQEKIAAASTASEISAVEWKQIEALLALALREDIGAGDATTTALVPADTQARGIFRARQAGVLAGVSIVEKLFTLLAADKVTLNLEKRDGESFTAGETLLTITGAARTILTGERLALNLLQRMSGVATLTRQYVEAVGDTTAKIMDTRKTIPGLRALDKLAVRLGGGCNHRQGLFDMILIKDNHLTLIDAAAPLGATATAVELARQHSSLPIMIEVDTLEQLANAIRAEPDFVLLDNMPPPVLREAIALVEKICREQNLRRPQLEASGGITLESIYAVAKTGVDRISVGAITHSATALDIGLDFSWR